MGRYVLALQAECDLVDIHEYVSKDDDRAADSLIDQIEETCLTLANNPMAGRARDELSPGLRSFATGNYLVCYKLLEDGITVVRVLHGARYLPELF